MKNLRRWWRDAPATTLFTLTAVVVWLITAVQSRSITANLSDSALADRWLLWGPLVSADGFDWLRALGSVFLHVDLGHLAINSFLLALIGREIERYTGTPLFVMVFLTGGIGASATVLWMDYLTPTAGASGAIFALMVLLVGVSLRQGRDLRAPLILIAVNVAYTFLAASVSVWGHLGGLLTGVLMVGFVISSRSGVCWFGVSAVLAAACFAVVAV
ncbi:rhomboid family intramembrane serine protease [Corynebacterium alimapuense]|uniref:rhomboid family intramembrane serine protease n=1 Tax=Corynebacterium alimapuense TaxID=1576874 RepID=UPI001FE3EC45|nr:rhomboid family intramembrane serine protease [Corynebacterium alimapuense]